MIMSPCREPAALDFSSLPPDVQMQFAGVVENGLYACKQLSRIVARGLRFAGDHPIFTCLVIGGGVAVVWCGYRYVKYRMPVSAGPGFTGRLHGASANVRGLVDNAVAVKRSCRDFRSRSQTAMGNADWQPKHAYAPSIEESA